MASHLDSPFDGDNTAEVQANAAPLANVPALTTATAAAAADYVASEILVRFRTDLVGMAAGEMPLATASVAMPLVAGLREVHLATGVTVADALATYRARPDVLYAEPNYRLYADAIPNDTRFGELWGLNNTGQSSGTADADIDAAEAWNVSTGSNSIVVGVIDTGVDYNHTDLAANIWTNPGEISGNAIDDDGDGYVDDVHGYNFVANNGNPMDDNGHGTHVSGTIGGIGNNGLGVAGVNWHVQIMPIKFLDSSGSGSSSAAIAAINYAALMHSRGVNIKLTSNSWGGGPFSQALQDAIAATQKQGMLFIAAAGNSKLNTDTSPNYPSAYPLDNIISVAATDRNDGKASFSNYGATSVDLAAPGVDVLSTTPNNTYSVFSGTSMATPHVAGVAALAWSVAPSATYQQIRDAIFAGVDPNNAFRAGGPTPVATGGRLNALGTLQRLGLFVNSSIPASGATLGTPPTSFVINFSAAVDPASVQSGDLTVDGIGANDVVVDVGHLTATFTYATTPVTAEGPHTTRIAAGAIAREGNSGQTIAAFNSSLRYDAVVMQVVGTTPPAGGGFALPVPLTYDVNFNEAVDPTSVQAGDLVLSGISGAAVSGVTLLNNNTTARFTLSGIISEGTLTATIATGTLNDAFGNPNSNAFTFNYSVDNGVVAFPTPLSAELPLGSLIYDRSVTGMIGPTGDADGFMLQLDAGQTLSLTVTPTVNTLQPAVELRDAADAVLATAKSPIAGGRAIIETIPIAMAGFYRITVSGVSGTVGNYSLKVTLNAAEELETQGTKTNDTPAAAQSIDGSFTALASDSAAGSRAAVIGSDGGAAGAASFTNFENGANGYVINNNSVAAYATGWWHLSTRRGTATGHSSVTSFYYGNETTGVYDTPGQANAGNITSPPITLAAATSTTLSFNYVLVNESPTWDVASVLVSSNGGASFTTIASSRSTSQLPATSSWRTASFDLSSYAGQTILLRFSFDTLDSGSNSYEGWYVDDVQISSPTPWTDYYSFTTDTNSSASLELKNLAGSGTQMSVEDASGQKLAIGGSKSNVDAAINDLSLPNAGTYYVRVTGTGAATYDLVVTKNSTFNIEPNNTTAQAQNLLSGPAGAWQYAIGHVGSSGDPADMYKINVPARGTVTVQTSTPAGGGNEFINTLDPRLRILDASGAAVAINENGAPDGRNAAVTYTNGAAAAVFYVEVAPTALSAATSGEYVLQVAGNAVALPPFQVAATNPASSSVVGTSPASFIVDFNDSFLVNSIETGDLLIDGSSAATAVAIIDSDSIRFSLPALSTGQHTFALSAGNVLDVQNAPLDAFSGTITIDTTPPNVIATNLEDGGTIAPGALTYKITFSKPMKTSNLSADDFSLKGTLLNVSYAASSYSFDATGMILTLNYTNLPEDAYTLTLFSGSTGGTNFTDPVGNTLDGEFNGTFPSGDGFAGGNFAIGFDVDTDAVPLPNFASKLPQGSLIYSASLTSSISRIDDIDRFTLALDAGQTITVLVTPSGTVLQPAAELRDPNNQLLASSSAIASGGKVLLQTASAVSAGTYTISISGVAGTLGSFTVAVTLNSALELEANGGAANDTLATAQDLSGSFLGLPGLPAIVSRGAVQGAIGTTSGNADYYAVQLTAGDTVSVVAKGLTSGSLNVELRNADDLVLTSGLGGPTNVTRAISNFMAATTGNYYLRVTGDVNLTYDLLVTKNAAFDLETNDTSASAQSLGASQSVLGYLTSGNEDWYTIGVDGAGGMLAISTATPGDGQNQFVNVFNPHIELYDPTNVKVATGTPGTDGRNETIQYQPTVAGTYRLRVISEGATSGEYGAKLEGSQPVVTPMQGVMTAPANSAVVTISPATVSIDFNRAYLTTSVQAADLLIDGVSIATAVMSVDGDTLSFSLPSLSEGTHAVSLAPGAVSDIQGTPSASYSGSFKIDKTAPRIIASSIPQNGDTPTPTISLQLTFSEPMRTTNLNYGLSAGNSSYGSSSASFDASGTVFSVVYTGFYGAMPDDNYTFTIYGGGCCAFMDLAGNALDGEFSGTFPSGDGLAGGNFTLNFRGDITTTPYAKSFNAMRPFGSLVYDTLNGGAFQSPNKISPAGDVDTYSLVVDAGQTISAYLSPVNSNLQIAIEIRDPNKVVIGTALPENGNRMTYLNSAPVAVSGTYTVNISGVGSSIGDYFLWLRLNTATETETDGLVFKDNTIATAQNLNPAFSNLAGAPSKVQQAAVMGIADGASSGALVPDYYSFSMAAGETATFTITMTNGTTPANLDIDLRDSNDTRLASSIGGATNVRRLIRVFTAPATGTYYVRVTGDAGGYAYNLVLTKNADFSLEPNNSIAQAQALLSPATNGDQWVIGHVISGDPDVYKVTLAAGATLTAQTYLPASGAGVFANALDPRLRILDVSGNAVATDENSASDGRNALLNFTNSGATATFYVEVAPTTLGAATSGEYTLRINGNSDQLPAFQVTTTSPTAGSSLNSAFTSLTADFNRGFLATTVQAADLLIDGIPAATAVTVVDGDTATFSIPSVSPGQHSFGFAASSIQDLQGMPLTAFTGTFTIDPTPPTVIGTSLAPNGISPTGSLSYQLTFSEAMKASNLSGDDFSLKSNTSSSTYTASSFSFNASGTVLTLNYGNLPEDSYALTLVSGSTNGSNFTDLAGNALDGEFNGTFPSGNGIAGGNFVVTFNLDTVTVAFPIPLIAKGPSGSLIYDGSTTGVVSPVGDSDSFLLNVNAGATISVLVSPTFGGLIPSIELRNPAGILLASTSSTASASAILQTISAATTGNYKISVSGTNSTIGAYKLAVTLNAALEAESIGGLTNDTLASAQNIDASAVSLGPASTRLAVLGSIGSGPTAMSVDFESGVLPATFTTYSSNSFGRIRVMTPGGSGNPSKYALLLDSNTDNNYALNEAIYHANLTGVTQATLSFSHYQSNDEADVLPADFQGHSNGDGISISDDGIHWHTILNAPTSSTWTTATTDLAAAALAAGMKFVADFQIKFQQYDNYTYSTDGRAYDNIQIQLPDPQDTYQLTLASGDQLSVVAKSLAGGKPTLQLLSASGAVLASATPGLTNVDVAISSFLVPAGGTYYLVVTGASGAFYSVVATRKAAFDSEPNDTFATAQKLGGVSAVLGSLGSAGLTEDWYSVDVSSALQPVIFTTNTPSDGSGQFTNVLNPRLELYDPSGTLVTSGTTLADGRNESILYRPLVAGTYRIRITAESGPGGEYVLSRPLTSSFSVQNLSITSPINEGDSATLSGSFDDSDTSSGHKVVVNWGGTESATTLNLPAGVMTFQATHTFLDDAPSGTSSDTVPVSITVTNIGSDAFGAGSTTVKINNSTPTIQILSPPATIAENDTFTLSGTYYDLGTLDTHTVLINWGLAEGSTTITTAGPNPSGTTLTFLGDGTWRFTASHKYLDDNPSGTATDVYQVGVTVTDDDGAAASSSVNVTIANIPPMAVNFTATAIFEGGTTTLSGTIGDVGTLDKMKVVIDWGNGVQTLSNVSPGSFSVTRQYLDNNAAGSYPISVTVTDDDGGTTTVTTNVAVTNLPPVITSLPTSSAGTVINALIPADSPPHSFAGGVETVSIGKGFTVLANTRVRQEGLDNVGIAYVMDTATGNLLHTLRMPSPVASAYFGSALAVAGDTVFVGAYTSISTDSGPGAVYAFSATTGRLLFTITKPPQNGTRPFGLAASGNRLVVGSPGSPAGKAFVHDATTGGILQTIVNPFPASGTSFGQTVAISGNSVLVGALADSSTVLNGGSAYLFDATTGLLQHTFSKVVPVASDMFGGAVAVDKGIVAIGSRDQSTSKTEPQGAVYLFDEASGNLLHVISNPSQARSPYDLSFASSLALCDNLLFVGTPDANTRGGSTYEGSIYVYDPSTGNLVRNIVDPVVGASHGFGNHFAVSGGIAVVNEITDSPVPTDGLALLVDISNGQLIRTLYDTTQAHEFAAAVATFGSRTAIGIPFDSTTVPGGKVQIWNAATGLVERTINSPAPSRYSQFGAAVALSGSNLVVGAVNTAYGGQNFGTAYILDANTGTLLRTLKRATGEYGDSFGNAVAIDNGVVAVTAYHADVVARQAGEAYLFDGATGSILRTLSNPAPTDWDEFGAALSMGNGLVAVGAPGDGAGATKSGSVYLFDSATGNLLRTIQNPTPAGADRFGFSIALVGTNLIVGAPGDDTSGTDSGAVYVFEVATGKLLRSWTDPISTADDQFGTSLAASGTQVLVGAPAADLGAANAGSTFLFDVATGGLITTMSDPSPVSGNGFGRAVALSSQMAIVGAPYKHQNEMERGAVYAMTIAPPVPEGSPYTLTGTFHDTGTSDTHQITIHWGGGNGQPDEGTTTLTTAGPNPIGTTLVSLGGGDWQFSATHRYLDDNPTASGSDEYAIEVSIVDDDLGTASASASITVMNTPPQLALLEPARLLLNLTNRNSNTNYFVGMCVAADDQYTAVGSSTDTAIYDTKTGNLLRTIPLNGFRVAIDGSTLAIYANGKVQLFDAATGTLVRKFENPLGDNTNDFGSSIAIRGNTLLIGAQADSTGAKSAGAVYIYDVVTGNLLHTIHNPFPSELGYFGSSVAIEGNTIAIGAQSQIVGDRLWGAAYIYDAATGGLLQTLASPAIGSQFGHSIALSGRTVVVGAWLHGGQMEFAGSAFAFDAVTGKMLYELRNPASQANDSFGWSVAVSDSVVVVGAYGENSVTPNTGAAYVYNTATGNLLATLNDPNPVADSEFSYSVAIASGKIFIGAPLDDFSPSGSGVAFVTQAVPTAVIEEGMTFVLSGDFHDEGTADTHTIRIDWSDERPGQPAEGSTVLTTAGPNPPGTTLTALGNGNYRFTATHQYIDDAPSSSSVDEYRIRVTISDDDQGSVQGSTSVVVTNVPPTPSIVIISSPRVEGAPVTITGAATDPAGVKDPITLAWRVLKEGATVAFAIGSGPNFAFTPDNDGNYRLELTAIDDDSGFATTTQVIAVANQAPVASDLSFNLNEDTYASIKLQATDVPADPLSYSIITPPQHGTLTGVFPNLTYRPAGDFNGTDRFTYLASDGTSQSNVATVTFTVRPLNDPPRFDSLKGNYSTFDENSANRGPALEQIVMGWAKNIAAGPADELSQTIDFVVTNDNQTLFAVQPAVTLDGTLAFTPMPNSNGVTNVTVMLRDGGGGENTSQIVNFQIQIVKQHPLHNAAEAGARNGRDVTGTSSPRPDGFIVAADVLAVVNYINAQGSGRILAGAGFGPPYPDVDGDDQVVPKDVIDIINYINSHAAESEAANLMAVATLAEVPATDTPASPLQPTQEKQPASVSSDLMNLIAADTAAAHFKRRRLAL